VAKAAKLFGPEPFARIHDRLFAGYFSDNLGITDDRILEDLKIHKQKRHSDLDELRMPFPSAEEWIQRTVTFAAAGPFSPSSISKVTRSPSLSDLKPVALMAV